MSSVCWDRTPVPVSTSRFAFHAGDVLGELYCSKYYVQQNFFLIKVVKIVHCILASSISGKSHVLYTCKNGQSEDLRDFQYKWFSPLKYKSDFVSHFWRLPKYWNANLKITHFAKKNWDIYPHASKKITQFFFLPPKYLFLRQRLLHAITTKPVFLQRAEAKRITRN